MIIVTKIKEKGSWLSGSSQNKHCSLFQIKRDFHWNFPSRLSTALIFLVFVALTQSEIFCLFFMAQLMKIAKTPPELRWQRGKMLPVKREVELETSSDEELCPLNKRSKLYYSLQVSSFLFLSFSLFDSTSVKL